MKTILFIITVFFTSTFTQAQFSSATLTAAGLTCAMCTKAIFNSLEKLPSVEKVDVDIKSSQFIISFKEGTSVDPDQLKNAVEEAGFSVARLKLTGDFKNLQVGTDSHIEIDGKTFHFIKANEKVLNGKQTITMVDKDYVSSKEFKKVAASTDHPCVETGKAEECCARLGASHNERIYHVTL